MFKDWTDREKALMGIIAAAAVIGIYEFWNGKRKADAGMAGTFEVRRYY